MRTLVIRGILVIAVTCLHTLTAAAETKNAGAESGDIVAYVIAETLNMTAQANLGSPAIGKPLKCGDKCKVLGCSKDFASVRSMQQPTAIGWVPVWLLVPQPLESQRGFTGVLRFQISSLSTIAVDSHSSTESGLKKTLSEPPDAPTAKPGVRERYLAPDRKTAVSSDTPVGKVSFDLSNATLTVYLHKRAQYLFAIEGEFLRTLQGVPTVGANEVGSGIIGIPQFFIPMETE